MVKEKSNFDRRLELVTANIASKMAQIDALRAQWISGAALSPQVLVGLKRSVLVTSSGASTRIEGAKLTDEEVEKLMRGLKLQQLADRDKQEVKSYYELLQNMFYSWRSLPFNESTIKHFHKELLKYVDKDQAHCGEYKKQENKVHTIDKVTGQPVAILFNTTPAYLTPKAMQELVSWTAAALDQKLYHPLIVIGNFVVEFLKIHPFTDGNGRLSRVLTNLLLLKADYAYMPYISHEKLVEDNKTEYYLALRRSQKNMGPEQENITPWLEFFLELILRQSQMAVELLTTETIDKLLSQKQLAVWQCLTQVDQASPRDIAKQTGITYATVRQALNKLLRLKKIERIGQGRSTSYRKISQ